MQLAYLILVDYQPNHLARLIRNLDGPECAFFVHVDAKTDDAIFKECIGEKSNVTFINRQFVNRGGFSHVIATLALTSAAIASPLSFQRFCLLSGADFPIKRNKDILAEFGSSKEFMRVDRKLDPEGYGSHDKNVAFHWFMDSADPNLRELSGKLARQVHTRTPLYHGAQWWALTRDCIEYIREFILSDPDYLSFFKTALCPHEIIFHSIVKQSPFASRITDDFETAADESEYFLSNDHGSHYIDWNAQGVYLPKVLDLQDLNRLLDSKCLFARKLHEKESGELIVRLENLVA